MIWTPFMRSGDEEFCVLFLTTISGHIVICKFPKKAKKDLSSLDVMHVSDEQMDKIDSLHWYTIQPDQGSILLSDIFHINYIVRVFI